MNWSTERDALIAQTIAFVQSAIGRQPDEPAQPFSAATVPLDNPGSGSTQVEQSCELPPMSVLPRNDIRKEVQTRVAAFQAHQHRFHREREAYFNSVLTKACSVPEAGSPKAPSV